MDNWDEDKSKELQHARFLIRMYDAEAKLPVTIEEFCETIEKSISHLREKKEDPRKFVRYLPSAADVKTKDDKGLTNAQKAEIDDNVNDLIKKLSLGESMYDYAFWTFYHEYNPLMLFDIKIKVFMTFAVHILVIFYAFESNTDKYDATTPYYGKIGMQLVRMVCAILLHLQYFPEVFKAIQMCTHIIQNAGNFKGQTTALPTSIALMKLFTAILMEMGSLSLFLWIDNEFFLLKLYAQLAVIGAVESKMAAILTARSIKDEMAAKPIKFCVKDNQTNFMWHSIEFFKNSNG